MLVNCAGHGIAGPSEEIPLEKIKKTFDVNFFGTVSFIQKVLPFMRKNNGGTIVNFSSMAGFIGLPFQAYYSASKHAIEGFSEALSTEVKPFGIKVIVIEPGDYKTSAAQNRNMFVPHTSSVYHNRLKSFFAYLNTRIDKGGDPAQLARRVVKISHQKYPALRYKFGSFAEKISKPVHAIAPARWFERIMEVFYGI